MWWRAVFIALVSVGLIGACTNDFDQYQFGDPPETGGGPSGPGPGVGGGGNGGQGGAQGGGGQGMGGMLECTSAATCPGMDNDCQERACVNNKCILSFDGQGTTCDDDGGIKCDGIGNCVECLDGTDCASGICDNKACTPGTCVDTVMNADETDVDCGGSCPPCADTLMCMTGVDCVSGYCNAGTCAPCVDDNHCMDVANTYCDAGVCVPSKVDGTACAGAAECASGFCPSKMASAAMWPATKPARHVCR